MAALGWLVSLAERAGSARGDEVVAAFRKAAEKTPADLRAIWDWFYLCEMRYDNGGGVRRGPRPEPRRADRPAGPLGLSLSRSEAANSAWACVTTPTPAATPVRRTTRRPSTRTSWSMSWPAIADSRTRRPELAQAQILQNVSDELRRAKRPTRRSASIARRSPARRNWPRSPAPSRLAARRGDVEGLTQLLDRYERLQAGRSMSYYYTGSYYFDGPGTVALAGHERPAASEKAYGDVLKLLDYDLAVAASPDRAAVPGRRRRADRARFASYGPGYIPRYQIWVGKKFRYLPIDFPTAERVLRRHGDPGPPHGLRDLPARRPAERLGRPFPQPGRCGDDPADAVYPRLCLSYILWWDDDKDEAIAEFTKVAEASRAESDLRLELAELLEQQGERDDALTLADAVQPLDNATMKRREELALRVSVLTGNMDRARRAAERLFGLRLDTDTQVRLAGQMHQLGLHELAEAVLGRARRRAGNKAAALVAMMLQYQRQDKLDVAVQVAMQILRSTTAIRQSNPNVYNPEDPDAAARPPSASSPDPGASPSSSTRPTSSSRRPRTPSSSTRPSPTTTRPPASGTRPAPSWPRSSSSDPTTPTSDSRSPSNSSRTGRPRRPSSTTRSSSRTTRRSCRRYFYQVINAFQQANKTEELLGLVEQIDLRQLGHPYYIMQL